MKCKYFINFRVTFLIQQSKLLEKDSSDEEKQEMERKCETFEFGCLEFKREDYIWKSSEYGCY